MNRGIQLLLVLVYWTAMFCVCFGQLQIGYSRIKYSYRLNSRTIDTYGEISFLDCVEECLVTTRCKSINYYKGANYCETNYEDKASAESKYLPRMGWLYSERRDWPLELAGSCASANCSINQKCQLNKYSRDNSFHCILSDCGKPQKYGVDLDNTQQGEAIAINKGMHVKCSDGFEQFGSGRLICRPSGKWDYKILCVEQGLLQNKFLDHVYFISKESKNWNDSKADCESRDAYLVEIDSAQENKWVADTFVLPLVSVHSPYNAYCKLCRVFIGGVRKSNGFMWATSNRMIEYTNWRYQEPNNYMNNENCIQMLSDGKWNDLDCSDTYQYVCEITTIF